MGKVAAQISPATVLPLVNPSMQVTLPTPVVHRFDGMFSEAAVGMTILEDTNEGRKEAYNYHQDLSNMMELLRASLFDTKRAESANRVIRSLNTSSPDTLLPLQKEFPAMYEKDMFLANSLMIPGPKMLTLRERIGAFYLENDPEKLNSIEKYHQFVMENGEEAFQVLLIEKYSKSLPPPLQPVVEGQETCSPQWLKPLPAKPGVGEVCREFPTTLDELTHEWILRLVFFYGDSFAIQPEDKLKTRVAKFACWCRSS